MTETSSAFGDRPEDQPSSISPPASSGDDFISQFARAELIDERVYSEPEQLTDDEIKSRKESSIRFWQEEMGYDRVRATLRYFGRFHYMIGSLLEIGLTCEEIEGIFLWDRVDHSVDHYLDASRLADTGFATRAELVEYLRSSTRLQDLQKYLREIERLRTTSGRRRSAIEALPLGDLKIAFLVSRGLSDVDIAEVTGEELSWLQSELDGMALLSKLSSRHDLTEYLQDVDFETF